MAPDLKQVEQQTIDVLHCLFHDDYGVGLRNGDIETDGPDDGDDTFDPVVIAEKLKVIADKLNKDELDGAVRELKKSFAQEALDQAVASSVDTLVKSLGHEATVAPELQLIKVSVALGLYVKKTCPNMISQLQQSMANFLNRRVGSWLTQQGGWEEVASVNQQ